MDDIYTIVEWDMTLTLYFDLMSIALAMGLLFLSNHIRSDRPQNRFFKYMCLCLLINGLDEVLVYFVGELRGPFFGYIYTILYSIGMIMGPFIVFFWALYVDYLLNGSMDHIRRIYKYLLIPVILMAAIYILVYVGIFYDVAVDALMWLYTACIYTVQILQFLYLFVPAYRLYRYKKNTGRLLTVRLKPFLIPVVISLILSDFSFYDFDAIGYAVGLVSIYFSTIEVLKYESKTQGYFNREYLEMIRWYAENGRKDYGSVIEAKASGDQSPLPEMFKSETPSGIELVKVDNNRFIAFMQSTDRNFVDSVTSLIHDDIEEYDEEHTDSPIGAVLTQELRGRDETVPDFVNRMIDRTVNQTA